VKNTKTHNSIQDTVVSKHWKELCPTEDSEIGKQFPACNKPVKSETRSAVREWLSQTQVGI